MTCWRAASGVAASAVRCPILRPGRGADFPYRCSLTSGMASAAAQFGSPVPPQIAEQVRHRRRLQQLGRSERQAADRAQLLLELAGPAGVERQVPGVVRPRRQLVDEQPAVARDEELDAQHADVVERLHHRLRDVDRLSGESLAATSAGATETSRM